MIFIHYNLRLVVDEDDNGKFRLERVKGHLGGKTKMAAVSHIEFLIFDRTALESFVISI